MALAPLLLMFGGGKHDGHQRSWWKAVVLVGLQGFEEQDGTSSSGNVWCGGVDGMQEDQGWMDRWIDGVEVLTGCRRTGDG